MMQNYVQGEIVNPTGKFEAVQTVDGNSLLFATDSNGSLNAFQETSGAVNTGWKLIPVSKAVQAAQAGGTVSSFDVGQSALDGTIGLAMSLKTASTSTLYLSLGNSNNDVTWLANPAWIGVPFDDAITAKPTSIVAVMFCETAQNVQYLVVDVNFNQNNQNIVRYMVNYDNARLNATHPSGPKKVCWVKHDVPVDIPTGNYTSCVGQAKSAFVDGIYTSGILAGRSQLIYQPIINAFDSSATPAPAPVSRLYLQGGGPVTAPPVPSAIATARNPDLTSDLYAISGTTLYCFSAGNQHDSSVAQILTTHPTLLNSDELYAMTHNGITTLWGKNSSNVVYYLSFPTGQAVTTEPVPILNGIERISPYVNKVDGGNTLFAAGGNKLFKLSQDPTSGIWKSQSITLSAPPEERPLDFMSYTTNLKVTDNNKAPVSKADVTIISNVRTPAYINGLYYVLSQSPVTVSTDQSGSITIVEPIDGISGMILTVTAGNLAPITINPMDDTFQRLASLNTTDKLSQATTPKSQSLVAGGYRGQLQTEKLVPDNVSGPSLQAVADNMGNLNQAYQGLVNKSSTGTPSNPQSQLVKPQAAVTMSDVGGALAGVTSQVEGKLGDLWQRFKSETNYVIHVVQSEAKDVWHMIVQFGEKAYVAVLDTIQTVLKALEWILQQIGAFIQKVWAWIQALLAWDDIKRSKDVLYSLIKAGAHTMSGGIIELQSSFDDAIQVADWKIQDWSGLGNAASQQLSGTTSSSQPDNSTPQSMLFANHFKEQSSNLNPGTTATGFSSSTQSLLNDVLQALADEAQAIGGAYTQLEQLAKDAPELDLQTILKRLIGIISTGLLKTMKPIVDLLFKLALDLVDMIIAMLDTPLHVPILSDLIQTAFGVQGLSILDITCWIAAMAYTVPYKLAHNNAAPFPDNTSTNTILKLGTSTPQSITPKVQTMSINGPAPGQDPTGAAGGQGGAALAGLYDQVSHDLSALDPDTKLRIFDYGHMAMGVLGICSAGIFFEESMQETSNSTWNTITKVLKPIMSIGIDIVELAENEPGIQSSTLR